MRTALVLTTVAVATTLMAQRVPQPDKPFTSAAEVQAMIEKAQKERKPDQPNFLQPLLRLAPYSVMLEYRVEGVDSAPTVHEKEAEIISVVDGAGTLIIGGKLVNEKRTNAQNLAGTALDGGVPQHLVKGDFVFVPENTAHTFVKTEGRLVIWSIHLPRGAGQ